jgi:hypothetical protein
VKFIESFSDDAEFPYIVTEMAKAKDLDSKIWDHLKDKIPIDYESILMIILQVSFSVQYLHE